MVSMVTPSDRSEVRPRNADLQVTQWLVAWGSCHLVGVSLLPAVRSCLQLSTSGWHGLPKPPTLSYPYTPRLFLEREAL